jgi:hypothetical protein
MDNEQPQQPLQPQQPPQLQPPQQQPLQQPNQRLDLQPFWVGSPEEWFFMAEASFELAGVQNQRARFLNVLKALPEHVIRTVNDLLQPGAPEDVYVQLRQRLLAAHGLTAYQRLEKLAAIQGLGGQKPSELLAIMGQLCPPGELNSMLFRFEFLKRLPRDLRVALAEDEAALPALAARADVLWSHSARPGTIAAIADQEEEEELDPGPINALQPGARPRGVGASRGKAGRTRGGARGRPAASAAAAPAADASPADFARAGTGMCFQHFVYGPKARKCTLASCTWQGGN